MTDPAFSSRASQAIRWRAESRVSTTRYPTVGFHAPQHADLLADDVDFDLLTAVFPPDVRVEVPLDAVLPHEVADLYFSGPSRSRSARLTSPYIR